METLKDKLHNESPIKVKIKVKKDDPEGIYIEEYSEYHKGPWVLVLQADCFGKPIHVVWGIPKNLSSPAVLVTAYRPDPERWSADFTRRKV